jgi:ankyrin repeat protein
MDLKEKEELTKKLVKAFYEEDEELVRSLVEQGADLTQNNEEFIPVIEALSIRWMDDFERVEFLLEHGANINAQDPKGDTALHIAAIEGRKDDVEFLLEHGANPRIMNKIGVNAWQIAMIMGEDDISDLLGKAMEKAKK